MTVPPPVPVSVPPTEAELEPKSKNNAAPVATSRVVLTSVRLSASASVPDGTSMLPLWLTNLIPLTMVDMPGPAGAVSVPELVTAGFEASEQEQNCRLTRW